MTCVHVSAAANILRFAIRIFRIEFCLASTSFEQASAQRAVYDRAMFEKGSMLFLLYCQTKYLHVLLLS